MKTKLFAFIFLALFCSFLTISASAATITVNTLADENNTNNAACSLREAINNANGDNTTNGLGCVAGSGNDSIVISVNGTITPTTVLPTITTSMDITGNGAALLTISGSNARRIFDIDTGTVSISNLTVTNGFNATFAGGISNNNGMVTLSGLVISNSISGQGGGIQNNGTMIVNNLTVTNNQATISLGGGILNYGTLTVSNSTISNNQGSAQGGGINNINGSLTVTDSTFTGNSTPNLGGAIINNNGTFFNVTRSTFTGNSGGSGSAIYIVSPNASTIANNTFFDNSVGGASAIQSETAFTMTNCTISGNRANGGAVRLTGSSATLVNNIIAGNTNNSGTSQADIALAGGTVATGSSFNNIIGTGGAGGLTNGVNGNQVGVSLANVRLLPLGSYGGNVQTMPIRTNSPARNAGTNTDAPATDARGFSRPQATTTDIGAFEIQTNSVVTNTNNSGAGSLRQAVTDIAAGDIIQFETPLFDTAQTISLSAGQITLGKNLTIYGNGANILNVQNTAAVSSTSRVFNNSVGFTVNISGMTISGGNVSGSGNGGGINNLGILSLDAVHITGNQTDGFGGGIYNSPGRTLNISNSTVSNNSAGGGTTAGGIDNDRGLLFTVTNTTISGNSSTNASAPNNGGGLWINSLSGTAVITNSSITNNSAVGTTDIGGGIHKASGSVTIRNTIIAGNQNNSTIPDIATSGGNTITSGGFNLVGNRGTATGFNQPTDQTGTNPLFENSDGKSLAPSAVIDPQLAPLALNGGTIPTHTLVGTSPAIDKGNSFGSTTDTRGLARPIDLAGYTNAAGGDGSDIGAVELQLAPTAANVSISGRVSTASGAGLANATVYLTDSNGASQMVKTGSFGNYIFADIAAGETYTINVVSKKFQFIPQLVTPNESIANLNFASQE